MDFQLSQEMKNKIEKNDQQERVDYDVSGYLYEILFIKFMLSRR